MVNVSARMRFLIPIIPFLSAVRSGAQETRPAPTATRSREDVVVDLTRNAIQARRREIIDKAMELTSEERPKFDSAYNKYEAERVKIGDSLVEILKRFSDQYATMTDAQAQTLLKDYLTVDEKRTGLHRKYTDAMLKVLPGKKVVRFFQLENKMDAAVSYNLAGSVDIL